MTTMRCGALALLSAGAMCQAQTAELHEIPGWTQIYGLSADGRYAVGGSSTSAMRWDTVDHVNLVLWTGTAYAVSEDGSAVIGHSGANMVRWTQETGAVVIGPKSTLTVTPAISADGTTAAWTTTAGPVKYRVGVGLAPLPVVAGSGGCEAAAVSADGSVVFGSGDPGPAYAVLPYRWVGNAPGEPVVLMPIEIQAAGETVSGDGSVGFGFALGPFGADAFRWTQEGGMQFLGFPPSPYTVPIPQAMTPDGSTIVGTTFNGRCFVWDLASKPQLMDKMLRDRYHMNLGDLWMDQARGISADGKVIVGKGYHGNTNAHIAWVVKLPYTCSNYQLINSGRPR